MSMTYTSAISRDSAAYGGLVDAVGGVATMVLAIVGLAGVHAEMMVAIATIVFGAALLIEGGAMVSEYARIMFPAGTSTASTQSYASGGLSALFLVGAAGIVLGVLALLGINGGTLTSVAIIAFGAALVLSSNSVWHLHQLKQSTETAETQTASGAAILANEMASGSAGVQSLAGLAAIVLGVLALAGLNPPVLTLAALIALGATLILTGGSLSATVISLMRPATGH